MKKNLMVLFLTAVFAVLSISPVMAEPDTEKSEKRTIWVSPSGNDAASGTKEKPLKTLDAAKNRAALMEKASSGGVEVIFRGGEYRFSSTVNFSAVNSGTADAPVVYKAYEGENVVFKGSVEVDASRGASVTDAKILSRLYDSARNKVVCFDLVKLGITPDMLRQPALESGPNELKFGEVNGVYLNGVEQTVACWPNGEGIYKRWETATDSTTIEYTDTQPDRWAEAKDFWLAGYPAYDYLYCRQSVTDLNTDEKTISVYSDSSSYYFTSSQSRRWKAINLLEEIDIPGEYYFDTDAMKLYLYPTTSLKNAKMEISWLNTPVVKFDGAKNITFDGIAFSQIRGEAVNMINVDNVDFCNCRFEQILGAAIVVKSAVNAGTDKDYWQVQPNDASYNCDFTGNVFYNIGRSVIQLAGGNVDTLEKSNDFFSDNMIYHSSFLAKNQSTIELRGCGINVVNNNISKCPYMAMHNYGNDHVIMYNEIHDIDQESDDCGAIYCGRNSIQRGTEIAYNFLHDLFTTEPLPFGFESAIYWDDNQTGISAHHNIISNSRIDLASNGSIDCNFSENTSVNMTSKRWHYINGGYSVNHNGDVEATNYRFGSTIVNPELYYERYPSLKEIFSYRSDDPRLAKFNKLNNNLAVNSVEATTGTNTLKYGQIKGNLELNECNDFVDPEKQDFRIKSDSETAKKINGILTDKFDIEKIGLVHDVALNSKTAPFRQIYPSNGAKAVQCSNIEFVWESAFGASNYRLVVAEDKELKNVVYDEIVPYTVQRVDGLKNNRVYYWKVTAINRSRELMSRWESQSCVFSFSTAIYDKIDTVSLNKSLSDILETLKTIKEGNEVGQYPEGTIDNVQSMIRKAEMYKKAKLGSVNQKSIDFMASNITNAFRKSGMVNKGFLNISDLIKNESSWSGNYEIEDGAFVVNGVGDSAKQAGTNSLSHTTGSCINSFDARLDTTNWAIISFAKYIDMVPYSASNPGYLICVMDDAIELQLSTGSHHDIPVTIKKSFANDGEFHHLEFGFVNIDIGNLVVLYVDGEPYIEYPDIFNTGISNRCEMSIYVSNNPGDKIAIKPSESTSSPEEFDDMVQRNLNKSAKLILDKFETSDKVSIFKVGATKILSPNGVFDVTDAPNSLIDGKVMISFDKIDQVFAIQTAHEGDSFYIDNGTRLKLTSAKEVNGHTMVSAEEVLKLLGHASVWLADYNMLIDGNFIFMNNSDYINKADELLTMLDKYNTDYKFS